LEFGIFSLMGSLATGQVFEQDSDYILSFADVEVNLDRGTVLRRCSRVELTPPEYELLTYFLLNEGRELSRDMILESVWSYLASPNTRTVDAHVMRLRQKLEPDPNSPRHFLTIHGVGYYFRC
jgi:DNA-binding response OmpR family regulator